MRVLLCIKMGVNAGPGQEAARRARKGRFGYERKVFLYFKRTFHCSDRQRDECIFFIIVVHTLACMRVPVFSYFPPPSSSRQHSHHQVRVSLLSFVRASLSNARHSTGGPACGLPDRKPGLTKSLAGGASRGAIRAADNSAIGRLVRRGLSLGSGSTVAIFLVLLLTAATQCLAFPAATGAPRCRSRSLSTRLVFN